MLRLDKAVEFCILRRVMLFQGIISSKRVVFHVKKQLKLSPGRTGTPHLQVLSASALYKPPSVVFLLFGKFLFSFSFILLEDVDSTISAFQTAAYPRYCDNKNNNVGKTFA